MFKGDWIVNGAGGNPLYVQELVKLLVEEGVIVESPERWRIDMTKLADSQASPAPALRSGQAMPYALTPEP